MFLILALLVDSRRGIVEKLRYFLRPKYLGTTETVGSLLNAGADVHATIEGVGETSIMRALHSLNAAPILKLLLRAGAAVIARDTQGRTALHYALHMTSFKLCACHEVVEVLLIAEAGVNFRCEVTGDTVLHTAAKINLRVRQYELNIQRVEEEFSRQSINEIYAHRRAIECTRLPEPEEVGSGIELAEIVELLLRVRSKADPFAKNFIGDAPLQCSIKMRNPLVSFLLFLSMGRKVHFTMGSIGDQEFLDMVALEARETTRV